MAWSRKKLTVFCVLIFAGQIGAIFALHTRKPLRARIAPIFPTYPSGFTTNNIASEIGELNDPLVFASAHGQGFSAHAWINRPQLELTMSNSIPAPHYLEFQRTRSEIPVVSHFQGLKPQLPFVRLSITNQPLKENPVVVQGAIADRPLLEKITPPQFGLEVRSNTVVQIAVQADGFPFTARILASSGSVAADLTALQLAKEAYFAPAKGSPLQWGELVFQWQAAPPPATNTPVRGTK